MGEMFCGRCYRFGIYWKNIGGGNQHTYCPYCGGINCQQVEEFEDDGKELGNGTEPIKEYRED